MASDLKELFFSKTNLGIVITIFIFCGFVFFGISYIQLRDCDYNLACFFEEEIPTFFATMIIMALSIYVVMFTHFYLKKKIKKYLQQKKLVKQIEKKEGPYKLATDKDVELSKKGSWISLILALYVADFIFYAATILTWPNPIEIVWRFPYLAVIAVVIWGMWKRKKWLPRFYLYAYPTALAILYLSRFIITGFENTDWQIALFSILKDIIIFVLIAWYFNKRCPECFKN